MKKVPLLLTGLLLLLTSCAQTSSSTAIHDRDTVSLALEQAGYTVSVSDFILISEVSYTVDHLYAVNGDDFIEVIWYGEENPSYSVICNFYTERFADFDWLIQIDDAVLCASADAMESSGIDITQGTVSTLVNADIT